MRVVMVAVVFAVVVGLGVSAQSVPGLDGKWMGKVTATAGEMPISASFTTKGGVVSGSIQTFHGAFVITEGRLTDGKWVLPFTTDEGGKGTMTGTLKDDQFSGEWDFRPMAVGTFALTRQR